MLVKRAKVINLFGQPGAGKSTTAAGLFYVMKTRGFLAELITEYAKEIVWDKRFNVLSDQLYLLAKQNRRQIVVVDQVDFIITDSPLLLGLVYAQNDPAVLEVAKQRFGCYDNVNYYIKRVKPYVPKGRTQTEEQSDQLAVEIKDMIDHEGIDYTTISGEEKAPWVIFDDLKARGILDGK